MTLAHLTHAGAYLLGVVTAGAVAVALDTVWKAALGEYTRQRAAKAAAYQHRLDRTQDAIRRARDVWLEQEGWMRVTPIEREALLRARCDTDTVHARGVQ